MVMSEQERAILYREAQDYIDSEREAQFRQEVIDAVEEGADGELYERFYTSLSFGTAGIRGIIGGGTNRINPYVIRKVTQGFADYLVNQHADPIVVIGYDSRNFSQLFAQQAALTMCANGVMVYLYDSIRPVPMLSFAVRYLKATAGIEITASHNPAQYNGYKVYCSDGGQVTPPHDLAIAERIGFVTPGSIRSISKSEAKQKELLKGVPLEVDEAYYTMVLDTVGGEMQDVKVAFTPLHGASNMPVRTLLARLGVPCDVVEEQEEPDGDFPTVSMPNPEDPQAMRLAIELAIREKADLVLGCDPDGDRLGIAIPTSKQKEDYHLLSGNEIAILLTDFLLKQYKGKKRPAVIKSLVTTDLIDKIAAKEGGVCYTVLTGFKYVAEKMAELDNSKDEQFLFGCEESFGYLPVNDVRDKDAVSSAILAVKMVDHYLKEGISLQERLDQIYGEYGFFGEVVLSYTYEGAAGKKKMEEIMERFRALQGQDSFAASEVVRVDDFEDGTIAGFPPANVVIIYFKEGEKMIVRPSGTEPKIKYYLFFDSQGATKEEFLPTMNQRVATFKGEF
ncbi:MAG: phospho-sugar mutase [Spirochaetales bacterium]|nr:phospho-sugar mutase [Spirochaetales bacterium]